VHVSLMRVEDGEGPGGDLMVSHSPSSSFFGCIELTTRYESSSTEGTIMKQRCHIDNSALTRVLAVQQHT
jgi:hypothetical protein